MYVIVILFVAINIFLKVYQINIPDSNLHELKLPVYQHRRKCRATQLGGAEGGPEPGEGPRRR